MWPNWLHWLLKLAFKNNLFMQGSASLQLKHPKQLYSTSVATLFILFAFYGMRAILIVYLVQQLHFNEPYAYALYGAYGALVMGLPFFGGLIADNYLGKRKSIIWGSKLMIIGHCILSLPYQNLLFVGLSFIALGSGFFTSSTAALIGSFYSESEEHKKNTGFTIFYMFCSIGFALGGLVCGYVAQAIKWQYGFAVAGVSMIVGLLLFTNYTPAENGQPPHPDFLQQKVFSFISREKFIYGCSLLLIYVLVQVFKNPWVMDWLMMPAFVLALLYVVYLSYQYSAKEKIQLQTLLIVFLVWSFFLALYEQSSGAMNLFSTRNVNMQIGGYTFSSLAINNFLPSFLLVLITPGVIWLTTKLHKKNAAPAALLKFAIGFFFVAACFCFLWWACRHHQSAGLVPLFFIMVAYLLLVLGEINIAPTIYASTYALSPVKRSSSMMGILSLSGAFGQYLAAKIGALMAVPEHINNPVLTLPIYSRVFIQLSIYCSVVMLLLFVVMLIKPKLIR